MIRVTKPEGFGNIQLEEVPIPEINAQQVRVQTDTTLISRGSELFRRYIREDAVSPAIMGYSLTGVVDAVGTEIENYRVGQRVMVVAPHAEYVVAEPNATDGRIVPLLDDVSFEEGTFLPLATSAIAWSDSSGVKAEDTIVILGQGLVGSLMMQVLQGYNPARIITVDALPLRCELSVKLGANTVINAEDVDPVEAVLGAHGWQRRRSGNRLCRWIRWDQIVRAGARYDTSVRYYPAHRALPTGTLTLTLLKDDEQTSRCRYLNGRTSLSDCGTRLAKDTEQGNSRI